MPETRRPRNQYAVGIGLKAGVAAVLGAAALAGPAAAQEAIVNDPPRAGQNITVFPSRDMVALEGYRNEQQVTIDIVRNGTTIGTTTAAAEGDDPATEALEGAIEVNHPGGACWATTDAAGNPVPAPDIQAGDKIVATSGGSADASTVAYVKADDYARYVKNGTTPVRDADGNYVIRMSGSAIKPDGTTYAPGVLEARLVNPERFSNAKRTVRADTSGASEGTLDYNTTTGAWTAEWHLSEADAAKAVDAEPRIMWLGTDPAAETELTIFEFGVTDEGCGGGAAPVPDAIGNFVPAAPVGVGEPPQNGRVIEVFPSRDFVALGGFAAGETAKVEVLRHTKDATTGAVTVETIGTATGLRPDAAGEIEINHPGGGCWDTSATMPFPDLRPHDQVRVTAFNSRGRVVDVNQTTIADAMIREDTVVTRGGDIVVEGEARLPNGSPWPATRADELEVRLRSKAFVPLTVGGRQDLRATAGDVTDSLTVNADGTFVAVFRNKSEAIQRVALEAATEQRIMWLGANPAVGSEGTFFERGSDVAGGPGGCDAPPAPGDPVRDTPIITPPDRNAPPAPVVGPQPNGSILVPGIGGLTTLRDANGRRVLAAQVDAQSLAKLAETGVVSVVLEQKARPNGVLYRFKIRKLGGGGGRAAAVTAPSGKAIATFWRAAPKKAGTFRFKLKSRALRGLKPGRYVIDVTPANAKRKVSGKTISVSFRVR